jgi:outer membrane protein assembly factor BamB
MKSRRAAFMMAFSCLFPAAIVADEADGILLTVTQGGATGVQLTWSGAPPNYTIYRSLSPKSLPSPSNQIGLTGFPAWLDQPPAGLVFYEINASCSPSPVEVCDGLDNNCDGTTDGPGSEASCSVPHAMPACVAGSCQVASCDFGWGDCNTTAPDGCEAPLGVAQSSSPNAYAGTGDQDLRQGYARVAAITNCGGCGVSCDDGISCTTDLCVPSPTGVAQCGHYSRAQCAGARCPQPVLPPGTPPPTEPGCAGIDADNDGLAVNWETPQVDPYTGTTMQAGVDLNCDGVISDAGGDLIWHEPPAGGRVKDVYLTIAHMTQTPDEPQPHAPSQQAVNEVVSSFADAGIVLHVDPNQAVVPHAPVVYMPSTGPDSCAAIPGAVSLYDSAYKGNPGVFDPRRPIGYHFMIFGHDSCSGEASNPKTSGMAEIRGNDSIVSLGSFFYLTPPAVATEQLDREIAGTMMHELGHTMGLDHGGPSDVSSADPNSASRVRKKPNYISVMNPLYQLNGIQRSAQPGQIAPPDPLKPRRFDFSHQELLPIDETFLDEFTGPGVPIEPFGRDILRHYCPAGGGSIPGPVLGPIDWNCDKLQQSGTVADVNADGNLSELTGPGDWDGLSLDFQCQPTFLNGPQDPNRISRGELSLEEAGAGRLRAGPLPCVAGQYDCDQNDANGCESTSPCSPVPTCSASPLWSAPLGTGTATAAAPDTAFSTTGSFSYVSQGTSVYAIYNTQNGTHAAGSLRWTRTFPTSIENFPAPVPLSPSGPEVIFLTGTDGLVRKIDPVTGADLSVPFDTRRPTCPSDQILATPAVQLRALSNTTFQSAQQDDLVFVITKTGCGDTTSNRVLAIRAATGTLAWTYNPASDGLTMNGGKEGCSIDYTNNILYCATEQAGAQHSLWAISTTTGARTWSHNAGSLSNRPMIGKGHVYVANAVGSLRAADASTGSLIWTYPIGAGVLKNPVMVSGGTFDGLMLFTDTAGSLHGVVDVGSAGVTAWPPPSLGFPAVTAPVVAPGAGKAYVGRSDGRLQQIDLATGAAETSVFLGSPPVSDPAVDFEGPPGTGINRVMAAANDATGFARLSRLCIPW